MFAKMFSRRLWNRDFILVLLPSMISLFIYVGNAAVMSFLHPLWSGTGHPANQPLLSGE